MQDAHDLTVLGSSQPVGRTFQKLCSALVCASCVAVPSTWSALRAADTPAPATKIASKTDDGTRSGGTSAEKKHPLVPVIAMAKTSQVTMEGIRDYTATFTKRERFGNNVVKSTMQMKYRTSPASVYLKFTDLNAGREVIYVEGRNKGNILVHEDGIKSIVGTLQFAPNAEEVMRENHYPVNQIGMANMLNTAIAQWEQELKHDGADVKYYPNGKIGDVECKVLEVTHAEQKAHFKFHKTVLYIDKKTNLPLRVEQYGYPTAAGESAPLIEEYTYTSVKTNVGLSDKDFDPKNKAYNF